MIRIHNIPARYYYLLSNLLLGLIVYDAKIWNTTTPPPFVIKVVKKPLFFSFYSKKTMLLKFLGIYIYVCDVFALSYEMPKNLYENLSRVLQPPSVSHTSTFYLRETHQKGIAALMSFFCDTFPEKPPFVKNCWLYSFHIFFIYCISFLKTLYISLMWAVSNHYLYCHHKT